MASVVLLKELEERLVNDIFARSGLVKFKNVEMQPKIIRQMIRRIDKLLDHLYEYKEKVFNN